MQQTEDEMLYQAAGRYVVITDEGKTIEKQVAVCLRYVLEKHCCSKEIALIFHPKIIC